jgi:glycosyltransferase involved in cell wall biosynthesis
LDVLQEGYRIYRERGGKLELRLYGKDLANGFVEPEKVPGLMKSAAAFVLASDFDPWPLVLLESMSAGCMIVASDRCTNRPELGKNWFVFKHGKPEGLARELARVEKMGGEGKEAILKENRELAAKYDCAEWVGRVNLICSELIGKGFENV